MTARATAVQVWVHREADGRILHVASTPPSKADVEEGDTVTDQTVWIADPEVAP